MSANLEDPTVATGLEKVNPHPIPQNGIAKECASHGTTALISHASKVMLKIWHGRLQHYKNKNFQTPKLGLEKAEEPEIKLPTFAGSEKKQGNSRKTSTSVSSTMLKPSTVCIITNCGKFLKRWEYQAMLPVS